MNNKFYANKKDDFASVFIDVTNNKETKEYANKLWTFF